MVRYSSILFSIILLSLLLSSFVFALADGVICDDGEKVCVSEQELRVCVNGDWSYAMCSPDTECYGGDCLTKEQIRDIEDANAKTEGSTPYETASGGNPTVCTSWTDWLPTNQSTTNIECLEDGRCRECRNITLKSYCIIYNNSKLETDFGHYKSKKQYTCDPYPSACEYIYDHSTFRTEKKGSMCRECEDKISVYTCPYKNEVYKDDTELKTECKSRWTTCPEEPQKDYAANLNKESTGITGDSGLNKLLEEHGTEFVILVGIAIIVIIVVIWKMFYS